MIFFYCSHNFKTILFLVFLINSHTFSLNKVYCLRFDSIYQNNYCGFIKNISTKSLKFVLKSRSAWSKLGFPLKFKDVLIVWDGFVEALGPFKRISFKTVVLYRRMKYFIHFHDCIVCASNSIFSWHEAFVNLSSCKLVLLSSIWALIWYTSILWKVHVTVHNHSIDSLFKYH